MEENNANLIIEGQYLENHPEIRAYIYQQLNDLAPFMLPETQTGIMIHKVKEEKTSEQPGYVVKVFLQTGESQIAAHGEQDDLYEAIADAKTKLLSQMLEIQDEVVSAGDREAEIPRCSSHPHMPSEPTH